MSAHKAARMDEFGDFGNGPRAAGGEELFLYFDDLIVPGDHGLVAEGVRIVLAPREGRIDPVRQFERDFNGVEQGDGMDFFGGLDLQAEETAKSGLASTDGDGRRIPGRLVVGERDAVFRSRRQPYRDRTCCG